MFRCLLTIIRPSHSNLTYGTCSAVYVVWDHITLAVTLVYIYRTLELA